MMTANALSLPAEASADSFGPALRTVRVLHLVNGEHYAGAERVQDLLAQRLPEFGFEVAFACIKPGRFAALRQAQDTPLHNLPMRSKWDLRPVRDLSRLIREETFALVHTHTTRTALLGRAAAALAGVPMVHHIHSQTTTEVGSRWRSWFNAAVERLSLSGVAATIAVSQTARAYALRQAVPERRVQLVPNGIPSRTELPERPIPAGAWTLGTVALFRPRKGLEVLLEAMALLRGRKLPVRLRAVGPFESPEYEVAVRRLAARLGLDGAIDWPGFSRDVPGELARMDLFVFPSILAEGLPMVVLEAMASGVPVVASRVDGVTDALGDDGAGQYVPPADPEQLAAAIARIIRGEVDWQALRRRAYLRQVERFSDRSMAEGVAAVYRQVLQGKSGAGR